MGKREIQRRAAALAVLLCGGCVGTIDAPGGDPADEGDEIDEVDDDSDQPADDGGDPNDSFPPAEEPMCGGETALAAERRVIPIYLAASDTSSDDAQEHAAALDRAMRGIQSWYSDAMGSNFEFHTFAVTPTIVVTSSYTRDEWQDFGSNGFLREDGTRSDGCGIYYTALEELNAGGLLDSVGCPRIGESPDLYFAVGGGGTVGSCGAGGLATTELETLIGAPAGTPGADPVGSNLANDCPNGRDDDLATDCSAAGVIAHEMGHGFGLPHTDDRTDGCASDPLHVMQEWWEYGSVTLCPRERSDLSASGFFTAP